MAEIHLPLSTAHWNQLVDQRLTSFLADENNRWTDISSTMAKLTTIAHDYVSNGGKKFRSSFCYWAYVGLGGSDSEAILNICSALEFLHAFALVHDDVMDKASQRRGRPTPHFIESQRHAKNNWQGDSDNYGDAVAILLGDLLFSYAHQFISAANQQVQMIWYQLCTELVMGQYLDVHATATQLTDSSTARTISVYKSAKYSIERPVHLGAAQANAGTVVLAELSEFGLPLGQAFQLRDDILGVFGNASDVGKPVNSDLQQGKPTLLRAIAFERANNDQKNLLSRVDDKDLSAVRDLIEETGARQEVENQITLLYDESQIALEKCSLSDQAKDELRSLAQRAVWRTR